MANFNRSSLVLAVNRALWGEVTPQMRQVVATIERGRFHVRIVIDGPVSATDGQAAARIGAAALTGDFKELKLAAEAVQLDAPAALDIEDGWSLIYKRKE